MGKGSEAVIFPAQPGPSSVSSCVEMGRPQFGLQDVPRSQGGAQGQGVTQALTLPFLTPCLSPWVDRSCCCCFPFPIAQHSRVGGLSGPPGWFLACQENWHWYLFPVWGSSNLAFSRLAEGQGEQGCVPHQTPTPRLILCFSPRRWTVAPAAAAPRAAARRPQPDPANPARSSRALSTTLLGSSQGPSPVRDPPLPGGILGPTRLWIWGAACLTAISPPLQALCTPTARTAAGGRGGTSAPSCRSSTTSSAPRDTTRACPSP